MRALFVILLAVNVLMFGLGQGWFGSTRTPTGRQPALLDAQLNPDALSVAVGTIQGR